MGQTEGVGSAKGLRVRQVRGDEQIPQDVHVAVPAQPVYVAEERGHDAAEPRDEHVRPGHERNGEQRNPVAQRQRPRPGAQEEHRRRRHGHAERGRKSVAVRGVRAIDQMRGEDGLSSVRHQTAEFADRVGELVITAL